MRAYHTSARPRARALELELEHRTRARNRERTQLYLGALACRDRTCTVDRGARLATRRTRAWAP